jgi:hypothetical protein
MLNRMSKIRRNQYSLFVNKFETLTNENKLILKQLIDQRIIIPDHEAVDLIDYLFLHQQGLKDTVTDEIIDNFKAVKLNNILQLKILKDKIKAEHETKLN